LNSRSSSSEVKIREVVAFFVQNIEVVAKFPKFGTRSVDAAAEVAAEGIVLNIKDSYPSAELEMVSVDCPKLEKLRRIGGEEAEGGGGGETVVVVVEGVTKLDPTAGDLLLCDLIVDLVLIFFVGLLLVFDEEVTIEAVEMIVDEEGMGDVDADVEEEEKLVGPALLKKEVIIAACLADPGECRPAENGVVVF
jgi:hypothetical protein